jgi:hypothetical protein
VGTRGRRGGDRRGPGDRKVQAGADGGALRDRGCAGVHELQQAGLLDRVHGLLQVRHPGQLHHDPTRPRDLDDGLGDAQGVHPVLDDPARVLQVAPVHGLVRRDVRLQEDLDASLEVQAEHGADLPLQPQETDLNPGFREVHPKGEDGQQADQRQPEIPVAHREIHPRIRLTSFRRQEDAAGFRPFLPALPVIGLGRAASII